MQLICYDIQDNYIRQKAAGKIMDTGFERIQYSVYLGDVTDNQMNDLIMWLETHVLKYTVANEDNILILSLTKLQVKQMISLGKMKMDIDEITGEKDTLIF